VPSPGASEQSNLLKDNAMAGVRIGAKAGAYFGGGGSVLAALCGIPSPAGQFILLAVPMAAAMGGSFALYGGAIGLGVGVVKFIGRAIRRGGGH